MKKTGKPKTLLVLKDGVVIEEWKSPSEYARQYNIPVWKIYNCINRQTMLKGHDEITFQYKEKSQESTKEDLLTPRQFLSTLQINKRENQIKEFCIKKLLEYCDIDNNSYEKKELYQCLKSYNINTLNCTYGYLQKHPEITSLDYKGTRFGLLNIISQQVEKPYEPKKRKPWKKKKHK